MFSFCIIQWFDHQPYSVKISSIWGFLTFRKRDQNAFSAVLKPEYRKETHFSEFCGKEKMSIYLMENSACNDRTTRISLPLSKPYLILKYFEALEMKRSWLPQVTRTHTNTHRHRHRHRHTHIHMRTHTHARTHTHTHTHTHMRVCHIWPRTLVNYYYFRGHLLGPWFLLISLLTQYGLL